MKLPKGKTGTARLSAKGGGTSLILTDGKPPAEFRIFRAGVNDSDYGPIVFDDIAAAMVMQNAREKGNPFYFDFNHGMTVEGATDEQGKSAGNFTLEVRDGELWAVNCMYTENGNTRLSSREYNLFSPAFRWIADETGTCRVFQLLNVAFVNLAGLDGLQPLAAASSAVGANSNDEETDMTAEEIKKLQDRCDRLEADNLTLRAAAHEVTALSGTLSLGSNATPRDVGGAVTGLLALRGEVRKITGQDTDEKAVAALQIIAAKAARTDAAETRLGDIELSGLRKEFDTILDGASKEGKLPPADRAKLESSILALQGGKVTPQAVEAAKTHVTLLGARVNVGGGGDGGGARPPAEGSGGALPPEIAKYAGRGVALKSLEAAYQRQQERRTANQ